MHRRDFVLTGLGTLALAACKKKEEKKDDISPTEDLGREHGVLDRILLIYEAQIERPDRAVVTNAAQIVRTFIEQYHEQLEEEFLFPRVPGALADTLRDQHRAGRVLTDAILRWQQPNDAMKQFVRMVRPHAAREETVFFPAFRQIVGAKEMDELGDKFEDREHRLFGPHGFEDFVGRVADLERQIGIDDLSKFTPNVPARQ